MMTTPTGLSPGHPADFCDGDIVEYQVDDPVDLSPLPELEPPELPRLPVTSPERTAHAVSLAHLEWRHARS
jgi:hypothetical protein